MAHNVLGTGELGEAELRGGPKARSRQWSCYVQSRTATPTGTRGSSLEFGGIECSARRAKHGSTSQPKTSG